MSRMFGTDGVRGIANTELTAELAYSLGRAGAFVLTEGTHKPKILVAKDTRISGDMLEAALVAGILSVGAEAVILGVVPTPAVAHLTREYNADAGVMISASHNPVEYNGIKFFDGRGYKLSDELEDQIQAVIESNFEGVPSPVGGAVGRSYTEETALREYIDYAMSTIKTDLKGLRVALDCANGAAYKAAVKAFRALGARVYVINDNPDGNNINENCGSTHMEELMDYVVRKNCDIGFAFDGDADRCLAVDEKGNMINGDFLLTICAKALKESGRLKDDTLVVTVMSNLGLDIAAKREGINLVKTKVGDRYVLEEMLKENYILGGEQSGHIIFLHHNTTGDGLVTALQIAAILKESGKTFSELAGVMKELPQVLVNAKVPNEKKNIYLEDKEIIDAINAVESKLNGVGRVLIRPSGTEPLVRVMLEGENQEEINAMANSLVDLILSKI
ncbi:phosphoglucosamine mutase [uncultured Clostridium sp.]|uniref:phosphoglucosamine mutase n=1 Tax=Clostridium sp. TaxID=1506 RepID=UPI0025D337F4|nr:phosphoglucosamine mutase [uncultured Clostridium sp.]